MTKLAIESTTVQFPLVDHAAAAGWARVAETEALSKRHGEGGLFFYDALEAALSSSPWEVGKPSMLIAHTTKGKGVSFMENEVKWHYKNPDAAQLADALAEVETHA